MSETINGEKSLHTYELLETDPVVMIDLSMKDNLEKGEEFHVDYNALRETLQSVDAPEDNSALSIEFGSILDKQVNGGYDPDNVAVYISHQFKPNKTQKALQHELKHYADITKQPVSNREIGLNIVGKIANKSIIPTTAAVILTHVGTFSDTLTGLSTAKYEIMDRLVNTSEIAYSISLPIQIGALALSSLYWFNKREITARKAEKADLQAVAFIEPPATS